jgi:hypothetical protein
MFGRMGTAVLGVSVVVLALAAGLVRHVTYEQMVNPSRRAQAQAHLYDCIAFRFQADAQADFDQDRTDHYGLDEDGSKEKTSSKCSKSTRGGSRMNRLYILLTVMVIMLGALFATHEALGKILTGTAGDDTLVGTDRDDRLTGFRGDDRFTGRDREDHLKGSRGNDRLKGSRGADQLWGSRGDDRLWGSRGNDKIFPGEDNDKVYAGVGNDLIYARDTDGVDYIDCGAGFDKVETIHRSDETLHNCERAPGPDRGGI